MGYGGFQAAGHPMAFQQQAQALQAAGAGGYGAGYGGTSLQAPKMQVQDDTVGNAQSLQVSGCVHQLVGSIMRGSFTLCGSNHGKPTYKKDQQVSGLDVMIYFWDQRDGANFNGWWFGPKVGGDQVWAYHSKREAPFPPKTGWKVPYDGAVDSSIQIVGRAANGAAQAGNPQLSAQKKQQALELQRSTQQKQQEELRKRVDEASKKRQDDQKKRMEDIKQQQEENKAAMVIRKVLQKVRSAKPEALDELIKELEDAKTKELGNCGTQQAKILEECDKGTEQARQRIEALGEAQRKNDERKAESAKKVAEAKNKAQGLMTELESLLDVAEQASKDLASKAEPLLSGKVFEDASKVAAPLEALTSSCSEKTKACSEFLVKNTAAMKVLDQGSDADVKQSLASLLKRATDCVRGKDELNIKITVAKVKATKKSAALKKLSAAKATIAKYDKSKKGVLGAAELILYAKGEFKYTLRKELAETISSALKEDQAKPNGNFHRLRIAIGIQRELERDSKRKEIRLAREKEVEGQKKELEGKLTELKKEAAAAEEALVKAEKTGQGLQKPSKDLGSAAMLALVSENDCGIEEVKAQVASTKASLKAAAEGVDQVLLFWLQGQLKPLERQLSRAEPRIAKLAKLSTRLRDEAKKVQAAELKLLEKKVLAMLKFHQKAKSLTSETLFQAMDSANRGQIDEASFVKFLTSSCEKEEMTEGETALSAEDFQRVFKHLDDEDLSFISKEHFTAITMTCMKVVKDTVLTSELTIGKDSKSLRRLDAGEVLELLAEPVKEGESETMRVHAKAMKDDLVGWCTVSGNQGTKYLTESGSVFKVVKETLMTSDFLLDCEDKEAEKKLKDRKLKVGELVEVRLWPRKEEKSGLMRMKCKAKSDGAVGWATTTGNQGTTFLQLL